MSSSVSFFIILLSHLKSMFFFSLVSLSSFHSSSTSCEREGPPKCVCVRAWVSVCVWRMHPWWNTWETEATTWDWSDKKTTAGETGRVRKRGMRGRIEGRGNWGSIGLLGRIIKKKIGGERYQREYKKREKEAGIMWIKIGLFLCNRCSLNCWFSMKVSHLLWIELLECGTLLGVWSMSPSCAVLSLQIRQDWRLKPEIE